MAYVHQISVSDGGVPKLPVLEALVTALGVTGDRQGSPKVHGGVNRAVCLFSLEIIEALQAEGHPIAPGLCGENLTLAAVDWARVGPGDRLRVGDSVIIEVRSYTVPCEHVAQWFKDGYFSRISQKRHPGWSRLYGAVLAEGTVRAGDPVIVEGGDGPEER